MNCIICLKIGDLYSPDYVNNLYKAVRKYTDNDFICFTDDSTGIDPGVICHTMLPRSSEGWWPTWSKIEIFGREELRWYDKKVYFDLDMVIQGDITPILNHDADWAMIRCKWKGIKFRIDRPNVPYLNSSCMVWKDISWIYKKWESDWRSIVKNYIGTDVWYHRNKITATCLPDFFYSYREGDRPSHYWENDCQPHFEYMPDYLVCLFHQEPNIHELDYEHVLYKTWNDTL